MSLTRHYQTHIPTLEVPQPVTCCGTVTDSLLLILATFLYVQLRAVELFLFVFLCLQNSLHSCASLPHLQNGKSPNISLQRGHRSVFVQGLESLKRIDSNATALLWFSEYSQSLVAEPSGTTHVICVLKCIQPHCPVSNVLLLPHHPPNDCVHWHACLFI